MKIPLVALLTDFGTRDWYVASLKAVIRTHCPTVSFIDITHDIPPYDIIAGAVTLAAAAPWFPPETIFLGAVDPGVGSSRALLAVRTERAYFVGPDNGLLMLCLKQAKRFQAVRLTNRHYWLPRVSHTFHGRDILAPVAAHIASGGSLKVLGTQTHRLIPVKIPAWQKQNSRIEGQVIHIDTFGNLITNLPASLLDPLREASATKLRRTSANALWRAKSMRIRFKGKGIPVVSSYAQGNPGQAVAIGGSLGLIELALRQDSAARRFKAKRGDPVSLDF